MKKIKSKEITMGYYLPNKEEEKAAYWCFRNNIVVCPVQVKYGIHEWYIEIEINGNKYKSPESYKKVVIWEKTYEYRVYYHDKYLNKNEGK
jgi:hypothetical protein